MGSRSTTKLEGTAVARETDRSPNLCEIFQSHWFYYASILCNASLFSTAYRAAKPHGWAFSVFFRAWPAALTAASNVAENHHCFGKSRGFSRKLMVRLSLLAMALKEFSRIALFQCTAYSRGVTARYFTRTARFTLETASCSHS